MGVLPPWGVIAVAAPWPMGTQPLLATRALKSQIKGVKKDMDQLKVSVVTRVHLSDVSIKRESTVL